MKFTDRRARRNQAIHSVHPGEKLPPLPDVAQVAAWVDAGYDVSIPMTGPQESQAFKLVEALRARGYVLVWVKVPTELVRVRRPDQREAATAEQVSAIFGGLGQYA